MSKFVKVAKISAIATNRPRVSKSKARVLACSISVAGSMPLMIHALMPALRSVPGIVEGEEVECSWHGSRFNITSRDVTEPPASEGVTRYNVRLTGDDIEILI